MKIRAKKSLSLLFAFCMIVSLFAGMTVSAGAKTEGTISAETVTGYVLGKDGTTKKELAIWTADSENDTYRDKDGKEIPGVVTASFANYGDGEKQDYILYTGADGGSFARAITVTKYITADGIIRELAKLADLDSKGDYDLIMASTADNWTTTYGKGTAASAFVSSEKKLYASFDWLEACRANNNRSNGLSMTLAKYPKAVEVPAVLAICSWNDRIGSMGATDAASLKAAVDSQAGKADMANALRFVSGMDPDATDTKYLNTGANSAKGVDSLVLSPVYTAFTVKDGAASGTEGADGYSVAANHATVTTADNWFKAAAGETVTLTVVPDAGYTVKHIYAEQGGADILVNSQGDNVYTFEMPEADEDETVQIEVETDAAQVTSYAVTVDSAVQNGTLTADKMTATAGETVTVTATAAEGYTLKAGSVKYNGNPAAQGENANTFTFTMPAEAVTITAEFVAQAWSGSTISTPEDFIGFAAAVNAGDDFSGKTVTLAGDVDLSSVADWTPVGDKDHPFAGTFDGAGKAITGLTIADVTGGYHGLFGYVTGTVKDFSLSGTISSDKAADFIGSVVGFNAGTISGVTSNVTINLPGSCYNVGGIAGFNTSGIWVDSNNGDAKMTIEGATGRIENCANTASILAYQKVGGIVGENAGTINACYNSGKVDASNNGSKNGVGGIAGRNGNNNTATEIGNITNCYNTGAVGRSGQKWTGGITGFNNSLSGIVNCYVTGEVVSTQSYSNPIAGNQEGAANTKNNYSLEGLNAKGSSEAERGIVKTADEMKAAGFVAQLNGENGTAFVADSKKINDGYPILSWQSTGAAEDPQQELRFAESEVSKTYGDNSFVNIATNSSANGGEVTYTSSNPEVATVDAANGQVTIVGAGTATITATAAAVQEKYAETSVSYTLQVAKKPVTITVEDKTRVYGEANPELTFTVPDNALVNGDTIADLGVTLTCTADATSPAGTPVAIAGAANSKNYAVTVTPGTLTITQAVPTGNVSYSSVSSSGKTLADAKLTGTFSVEGTLAWKLTDTTEVTRGTSYEWVFTPADAINYAPVTGSAILWAAGGSGGGGGGGGTTTTYTVTVAKAENGTVKADRSAAASGQTVTVTVTPDSGYALDKIAVTDSNGNAVTLKENSNGSYSFTMPSKNVTVTASFTKSGSNSGFRDVPEDAYFAEAVKWAVDKNITTGTSATTFSPDESCTRAQMAVFLWRAAGSPEAKNASSFADVAEDAYYAKAVAWAVENGITKGTDATHFSPEESCTRAQMATFLYRYAKTPAVKGDAPFADVAADAYYAKAVAWAVESGVTKGTDATHFSPDDDCTRAQIVTFLFRLLGE